MSQINLNKYKITVICDKDGNYMRKTRQIEGLTQQQFMSIMLEAKFSKTEGGEITLNAGARKSPIKEALFFGEADILINAFKEAIEAKGDNTDLGISATEKTQLIDSKERKTFVINNYAGQYAIVTRSILSDPNLNNQFKGYKVIGSNGKPVTVLTAEYNEKGERSYVQKPAIGTKITIITDDPNLIETKYLDRIAQLTRQKAWILKDEDADTIVKDTATEEEED